MGRKISNILLSLILLISMVMPNLLTVKASTDYVVANRSNPATLVTNGEAEVTLNIQGTPPVNVVRPNDVVLVIDKSGSMQNDNRMQAAKDAAKGFVDMMDFTKHRVGIVDYSDRHLTRSLDLNVDVDATKSYIDNIQLGGGTGTDIAIQKGMDLLTNHRSEAQPVMVLLTDGEAQNPDAALRQAKAAKDAGIVFYTVALLGKNDKPDGNKYNELLEDMATTAQHHHFVLGSTGLKEAYDAIVKEIGMASATDVVVTETISPELEIVPGSYDNNIPKPNVSGNTLTWNFLELKDQPLSFTYKVRAKQGIKAGEVPVVSESKITYKDYTGLPRTYTIQGTKIEVIEPAPIITSIVESQGKVEGGETVIINGEYFQKGATVTFNGKKAENIVVESGQKIIVVAPSGMKGIAKIEVENPDAQVAIGEYTYVANPEVTSLLPNRGELSGGNISVIYGKHFEPGTKVYFNDNEVPIETFLSSTSIRIRVPAAEKAGLVNVKVVNPDNREGTLKDGYEYNPLPLPSISSITPNEGLITGGETIEISGKNFIPNMKIMFGTKEVIVNYKSASKIEVTVPAGDAIGPVDVHMELPDKQMVEVKGGYTYKEVPPPPAPEISEVYPKSGSLLGGNISVIYGKNFESGTKVYFNDKEIPIDAFLGGTSIRIRVPASEKAGLVDVKVVNPDGQEVILKGGYEYLAPPPLPLPIVSKITPDSGIITGGDIVEISGVNFVPNMKVIFGTKEAVVSYKSSSKIEVTVPAGDVIGPIDVHIELPDKQVMTVTGGYTYKEVPPPPAPEVSEVYPKSGKVSGGNVSIIYGKNFERGAKVYFNDKEVPVDSFLGSTSIRIRVPAGEKASLVDVKVVNPDGREGIIKGGYEYLAPPPVPAPEISEVYPKNGEVAGGKLSVIYGKNFERGAKVYFNDKEIPVDSFLSPTSIRIRVPAGEKPSLVDVKVVNPDGQEVILKGGYEYLALPLPVVSSITPDSGVITGGEKVEVYGKNFVPNMKVTFGKNIASVKYISASRIEVTVPVGDAIGSVDVHIELPDKQTMTVAQGFTYKEVPPPPAPEISEVYPNNSKLAGGTISVIYGKHFVKGAKVYFNDKEVPLDRFLSSTSLRIRVPASEKAGLVDVKVVNPDGQAFVLKGGFEYLAPPPVPAPEISSLSATFAPTSGGKLVVLYGKNFDRESKIKLGDLILNLEYFNSNSSISVRVPANAAGNYDLKVINPDGKESNVMMFEYK
jgi:uncharacterized protein YegL